MTPSMIARAFHRFGYGPRPGDIASTDDPRSLIEAELDEAQKAGPAGGNLPGSSEIFVAIRTDQQARKVARLDKASMALPTAGTAQAGPPPAMGMAPASPAPAKAMPSAAQAAYVNEVKALIDGLLAAPCGFVERLAAFWSNHFAVQVQKDEMVRGLAGAFEREAIRPHLAGRFEDMVLAATEHPAMLRSLDNMVSVGPDSPFGRKSRRGLNENHARELMELHTVGVDGGYRQADVTALARVLTGWTVNDLKSDAPGIFVFRAAWHEPGPQTVMRRAYASGGLEQGRQALLDLARDPATAGHIARKLATAFVSDDPDSGLVDRLARTFAETSGDLGAVSRALLRDEAALASPGTKLKSPQEYLFSAARGLSLNLDAGLLLRSLRDLGEAPWDPPSPAGFPLDSSAWLAPDGLNTRIQVAERLASIDKSNIDPRSLVGDLLGGTASRETRQAVARAETRQQAIALLVMSPEFQRR